MVLQEGKKAPAFKGKDQDGNTVSLADYKGKKLVLYFYPHDDTPTCTDQACNLRDNYALLQSHGLSILGVSEDDEKSHKKFEKKYNLPFPLVADTSQAILKKYGVWDWKTFMGKTYIGTHRTTFLIDEKGKIAKVITRPRSKKHAEEILEAWKEAEKPDGKTGKGIKRKM
ncbi:thioredoxin-dependent thiol peroxidase [Sediminibacterium soli]|uniref:thioredoxin-dependent thiol peroxidase n=1 Tax=Sediminibacterium soli TaxID=2698829 RepID=UPI001379D204|nr:thioredoxin-dependent thiol peroxidase [Sediminibacterium soli]NCI45132.1 thioredoxin-dependent thiol peroxidase [Sediminibacterium soli]